jgi:hypothetical protein
MTTRRGGDSLKVGDPIVDKDEALQVSGGCEPLHDPLHDPLAPPRRPMRILCPVVEALVLAMLGIQAHPGSGRAIRTGLVSDHHAWRADELAQELLRCAPTLAALNQGVKNEAQTKPSASTARTWHCVLPSIDTTTSSRCHLSQNCGARRRILLAQVRPNV